MLDIVALEDDGMARPAAAASDDPHRAIDLPSVANHVLVTLAHPERATVAAGNTSRRPRGGRRRLEGRLLTRRESWHVTSPHLSYTAMIADSYAYVKKRARPMRDLTTLLYSP